MVSFTPANFTRIIVKTKTRREVLQEYKKHNLEDSCGSIKSSPIRRRVTQCIKNLGSFAKRGHKRWKTRSGIGLLWKRKEGERKRGYCANRKVAERKGRKRNEKEYEKSATTKRVKILECSNRGLAFSGLLR